MKDDGKVPMVTSSFRDQESAAAYSGLISKGYATRDIHVMMSDDTRKRLGGKDVKLEKGNKAAEGAAGAATGGLVGALVGMGIPEDRAKIYEQDLKHGSIILGVRPKHQDDAEYFENEWRATGEHVYR